ncbi:hypothetical protein EI613_31610 (plasmid) [Azospirillum sp. 412522]|nr:hypothetical protein [Azospirillum sp. 412522]MBY6266412.1 hypothetical protein [Azospirillum sp. 412522]
MATETFNTNSWDNAGGLSAAVGFGFDDVSVSGVRSSSGAWGLGPVNYQAGATTDRLMPSSGTLDFDLIATGSGAYGSGSGYKAYVQLWNDYDDVVAIGLIHDPGASPNGYTVMVEGAAGGTPIGGYWGSNMPRIEGAAHHFTLQWTQNTINVLVDNLQQYQMTFGNGIDLSHPSISFLGAAREHGDTIAARFDNIDFSSVGLPPVTVSAAGTPRASIQGTVNLTGSGVGYASYLNLHDANGNAVAFGFQADANDRSTDGLPTLHYNVAQNGSFAAHRYYDMQAPGGGAVWKLSYYEGDHNYAVFSINGTPVASADVTLSGRVFFQTEVNAAQNGDTVHSTFQNVVIGGQWANGRAVSPNGSWNTSSFDFWGLDAAQTSGSVQGASFALGGTLSGLPAGADWDNIESINNGQFAGKPAGAIGMIAEWWFGA